jgi:hypothetical protein
MSDMFSRGFVGPTAPLRVTTDLKPQTMLGAVTGRAAKAKAAIHQGNGILWSVDFETRWQKMKEGGVQEIWGILTHPCCSVFLSMHDNQVSKFGRQ